MCTVFLLNLRRQIRSKKKDIKFLNTGDRIEKTIIKLSPPTSPSLTLPSPVKNDELSFEHLSSLFIEEVHRMIEDDDYKLQTV